MFLSSNDSLEIVTTIKSIMKVSFVFLFLIVSKSEIDTKPIFFSGIDHI